MIDVAVVGGGLFGTTIARALRAVGRTVAVVDCQNAGSGSGPAACLLKPGWFSGFGREVWEPGLETLKSVYAIQHLKFKVLPPPWLPSVAVAETEALWIDPEEFSGKPDHLAELLSWERPDEDEPVQLTMNMLEGKWSNPVVAEATTLVLAMGIWTPMVCPHIKVGSKAGAAFLYRGQSIDEPFIKPWAPYKQIVAFNRPDGVWIGDGSAIKPENFDDQRVSRSRQRCQESLKGLLDCTAVPETLLGSRPFTSEKPCHCEQVAPRVYAAVGGSKNGAIAAGWAAHRILQAEGEWQGKPATLATQIDHGQASAR